MRASRRVVTVVFADLVGFTELSERLDAEDVAAIQQAYFARSRESLVRHGGLVEKFIGDAVVGSFGVARAMDDDADRAVKAALDIVAAVSQLADTFGLARSQLQVRVGVNTGEVLITGDRTGGWQLTGDVVNVTARLQSRARPGTVLVGPETALAVESTVVLHPLGPVPLKGKAAAVDVWEVSDRRPTPLQRATLLPHTSRTVGRELELDTLFRSWQSAEATPGSWLITAPPGVGKSRLVHELAARVEAAGGDVWVSNASPGDGPGYRCIAALVRQSLGPGITMPEVVPEVTRRLLHRGASELRAHVSAEHVHALLRGGELFVDPADLFASWTAVLESHESAHPPVWVVEDLHHAGPDLLEFLRFLAANPGGSARLLVLNSRPTPAVEALAQGAGLRSLHLDPLSDRASVEMVEEILGPAAVPARLVRAIAEQAQGNPLFIEELFRSWVQAGLLHAGTEGRWQLSGSASADRLPTTVQSVYLGQLDRLPEQPRQVIHSGSIPGYTFPSTALPVLDVVDADVGLGHLTDLGLIVGPHEGDTDPVSYTYRHGLLREVAYASLSRADRARLHLRFARWVQAGRTGGAAEEAVGRHLAAAYDNWPRLAQELEQGLSRQALADEAGARLEDAADLHLTSAPTQAALLFEQALDLCAPDAVATRLRRSLKLGQAQLRAAQLEESMQTFARLGDLAPDGSPELVPAALGYEAALFASRLPRQRWGGAGKELVRRALEAATDDGSRARLLASAGRADIFGGDVRQGRSTCREAVGLAERSGSDAALAHALLASVPGQSGPDTIAERRRTLELAARAARRAGDLEAELESTRLQVTNALEDGDLPAFRVARDTAETLIEQLRRPLYFWYPPMWRAMTALLEDDPQSASLVDAFREEGTRSHYRDVLSVHAVHALELHTKQGKPSQALPLLRHLGESDPHRWGSVLAAALVRSGERKEAQELLDRALEAGFEEPRDLAWTYLMALRAECAAALDDVTAAAEVTRLLEPWRGHVVVLGAGALCLGSVSHYLGLAARTTGDLSAAIEHFRESLAANQRLNAKSAMRSSAAELERTLARGGTDTETST
ncbi:MAG: adenylate/guanylate cyclase domain-containing protein [Marmoricola sp.]